MAEGSPDQEIVTRFVVEASDALAKAEEYNQRVEEIKKQLLSLAATSSQSLKTVAEGMKQAFATDVMTKANQQIMSGQLGMKGKEGKEEIGAILDTARAQISQYNSYLTEALRRTNEEVAATSKEGAQQRIAAEKNVTEAQKSEISKQKAEKQTQAVLEKAILDKTVAAQQEYVMAWTTGNKDMSAAAQNFGAQVQGMKAKIVQAATQSGQSVTQVGAAFKAAGQPIAVVDQALRELNTTASATPGVFSRVGGAIQVALGIGLEQIVMKTVRVIIDGFKQLTQAGFEYAQALVRLQIGTNLLQKAGLNITMRETLDLVNQLSEKFPVFTRKAVIEGVGYLQILSQNLGLSAKQMKDLSEVSGALAVILGKDVGEATKEIALFLSSGYGEALQRAGILASKASVEHELLAMGIKEGYNQVDQATRAQAGYNVIMQQATELTKKAEEAQKGYAFSNVRLANSWQKLVDVMGIRMTPALANLLDFMNKAVEGLKSFTDAFSYNLSVVIGNTIQLVATWKFLFEMMKKLPEYGTDFNRFIHDYLQGIVDIGNQSQEAARKMVMPDIFTDFKDDAIGAGTAAEEAAAKISQATEDLHTKLLDEQERFKNESESLWTDYQRDIEKINRDGLFRQEQLFTDFIRSIAQIEAKLSEDIYNENLKYAADVADVQRDYASRRADVEQKYRDRELKAQRDFEEKMRRLREDFILDMEDALRERDARQVLRLIRQFNVNQDRLKRERDQEHEDLQREYRQEIKDLEKQRDERLATLAREHQARIAALQRQAQIEREQAWLKYQQEMEDLRKNLENQKNERAIRYEEQKADLEMQTKERLEQIAKGLMDEYSLTQTMLDGIMALYRSKYGPGGELEGYYLYVISMINAMNQAISAAIGTGFGTFTNQQVGENQPVHGYATGGSFVASSPTIAKFGEVPELVTATPLNQMSRMPSVGRSGRSNTGRLAIDLFLSPDLEARIIDKTLDINADVMVDIQRRR